MSHLTKLPITADALGVAGISFVNPLDAIFRFNALSTRQVFSQSNLVSDDRPGHLNAQIQDPNLINPWGVAFGPNSPFWVNNNHTGTATIYHVDPTTDATMATPLVVTIAPPAGTIPRTVTARCCHWTRPKGSARSTRPRYRNP